MRLRVREEVQLIGKTGFMLKASVKKIMHTENFIKMCMCKRREEKRKAENSQNELLCVSGSCAVIKSQKYQFLCLPIFCIVDTIAKQLLAVSSSSFASTPLFLYHQFRVSRWKEKFYFPLTIKLIKRREMMKKTLAKLSADL
jgi:hypothetical protein